MFEAAAGAWNVGVSKLKARGIGMPPNSSRDVRIPAISRGFFLLSILCTSCISE